MEDDRAASTSYSEDVLVGQRLRTFINEHQQLTDVIVTIAVLVVHITGLQLAGTTEDRNIDGLGLVLVVIPALLTFFRRTHPIAALVPAAGLGMSYWILDYEGAGAFLGIMVLLYSAAAYADERRRSTQVLVVFTVVLSVVLIAGYISPDEEEVSLGVVVFNLVVFQFTWLAGDVVRNRRAEMQRLKDRMELAEAEQRSFIEHAVEAERNRIARELHDVVAHAMSVIVVQAEGARRLVGKDEESVRNALAAIEHTGRTNLNDIRGIVGLLRTNGTEYAPAPELSMLDKLVEQCSEAGLDVSLDIVGTPRELPPMIELSGYRIVQESLTNTLKHAGPAARAQVTIGYLDDAIDIAIVDDGRGASADVPSTPGHGLLGMRERVEAFGGQIQIGPKVGGGFAVEARIPLGVDR